MCEGNRGDDAATCTEESCKVQKRKLQELTDSDTFKSHMGSALRASMVDGSTVLNAVLPDVPEEAISSAIPEAKVLQADGGRTMMRFVLQNEELVDLLGETLCTKTLSCGATAELKGLVGYYHTDDGRLMLNGYYATTSESSP
eukprot:TRINITY_DN96630_c0_g1_i1.p1 TRINITY_DN96630_c0_g1~~TRINITY_DN96630_c0_g1_i1.p1  ORF type:complete len:164 (+),score=42.03 TRINITY_DN96630_c0_g1_i1:66-494(+)